MAVLPGGEVAGEAEEEVVGRFRAVEVVDVGLAALQGDVQPGGEVGIPVPPVVAVVVVGGELRGVGDAALCQDERVVAVFSSEKEVETYILAVVDVAVGIAQGWVEADAVGVLLEVDGQNVVLDGFAAHHLHADDGACRLGGEGQLCASLFVHVEGACGDAEGGVGAYGVCFIAAHLDGADVLLVLQRPGGLPLVDVRLVIDGCVVAFGHVGSLDGDVAQVSEGLLGRVLQLAALVIDEQGAEQGVVAGDAEHVRHVVLEAQFGVGGCGLDGGGHLVFRWRVAFASVASAACREEVAHHQQGQQQPDFGQVLFHVLLRCFKLVKMVNGAKVVQIKNTDKFFSR